MGPSAPGTAPDGGASSCFWMNLAPLLNCLDQLLLHSHSVWLRSHSVWLAGGALGDMGDVGGLAVGDAGAPTIPGASGLAVGDAGVTVCAASHTVGALVSLCQALSTPLHVEGGGMPGITRSSTCQRVPLAVLTSEPATLRMVLQLSLIHI